MTIPDAYEVAYHFIQEHKEEVDHLVHFNTRERLPRFPNYQKRLSALEKVADDYSIKFSSSAKPGDLTFDKTTLVLTCKNVHTGITLTTSTDLDKLPNPTVFRLIFHQFKLFKKAYKAFSEIVEAFDGIELHE